MPAGVGVAHLMQRAPDVGMALGAQADEPARVRQVVATGGAIVAHNQGGQPVAGQRPVSRDHQAPARAGLGHPGVGDAGSGHGGQDLPAGRRRVGSSGEPPLAIGTIFCIYLQH